MYMFRSIRPHQDLFDVLIFLVKWNNNDYIDRNIAFIKFFT